MTKYCSSFCWGQIKIMLFIWHYFNVVYSIFCIQHGSIIKNKVLCNHTWLHELPKRKLFPRVISHNTVYFAFALCSWGLSSQQFLWFVINHQPARQNTTPYFMSVQWISKALLDIMIQIFIFCTYFVGIINWLYIYQFN